MGVVQCVRMNLASVTKLIIEIWLLDLDVN